jgi:hypothetical protein
MRKLRTRRLALVLSALVLTIIPASDALSTTGTLGKLVKFVPADSEFVLVVNVAELRSSELVKKIPKLEKALSERSMPSEVNEFFSREGIDLGWNSLDEIVLSGSLSETRTAFLALVKGNWKSDALIAALAKAKPLSSESGKSGTVYYLADARGENKIGIFPLGVSSLAVGAPKNLELFLENRRSTKSGLSDNALMRKLLGSSTETGQIWGAVDMQKLKGIVSRSTQGIAPTGQALPSFAVLEKLKGLAVNVNAGKAIDVELHGFADSPKDAAELQQFVRGLIALAKLATPPENYAVSNLLDEILLEQKEEKIRLVLTLTDETLKLFQGSTAALPFPKQLFPAAK